MDENVRRAYADLVVRSRAGGRDEALIAQSERFANGGWQSYRDEVIARLPSPLTGRIVADLGCKFGHMAPLVLSRGAARYVGLDVSASHLASARALFAEDPERIVFEQVDPGGWISLPSESVDVVLVVEVISHIVPSSLDTVVGEIGRVLRPGGYVFVSDGNNARFPGYVESLRGFWEAWENGPDGARTERDVVDRCYRSLRADWITASYPSLTTEQVRYLATNTSGLHGEFFRATVRRYVETGALTERPYRSGTLPIHPEGFAMERAFDPKQVVLALAEHGLEARQILPRPTLNRRGWPWRVGYAVRWIRYWLDGLQRRPGWPDGLSQTFVVAGFKPGGPPR